MCWEIADHVRDSRDELHRDGVEGKQPSTLCILRSAAREHVAELPVIGARGYQQRAMGSIIIADAGDRQWHIQLVRSHPETPCHSDTTDQVASTVKH